MRYVPVGSQVYAYALRMDVKKNLEQIFQEVAAGGYQGIELFASSLTTPDEVDRVRGLIDRFDLPVIAAYFSAPFWNAKEREHIVKEVENASRNIASLGGHYLLLGNHHDGMDSTSACFENQAETLKQCATLAGEFGVCPLYHTYSPDVVDGERNLNEIFSRVSDHLFLAPDLDWISRGEIDPQDFLKRWGSRARYVHLRDSKDGIWVEAIGEGNVDFKAFREVLDEIEFEGWIVVELALDRNMELTRPIGESLKLSREHVRETMGF